MTFSSCPSALWMSAGTRAQYIVETIGTPGLSVEVRTGTCTTVNMDTKAWYAEAAVGITPSEMPNHPGFQALGWWIVRVLLKM